MSQTYAERLRDPRWQKKRLEIMSRDGFKCRECGSDSNILNVHHIYYDRLEPWACPEGSLITLCEECHKKAESLRHQLGIILFSMPLWLQERLLDGLWGNMDERGDARKTVSSLTNFLVLMDGQGFEYGVDSAAAMVAESRKKKDAVLASLESISRGGGE